MRRVVVGSVLAMLGCENFDVLLDRCRAEGRCGTTDSGMQPPPNPGVLKVAPATLSFTSAIGGASDPQDVTLTNTGPGDVSMLTVDLSGANAGDFHLSQNCPQTLTLQQQCIAHVTFSPTPGVAQRSATLIARPATGAVATVDLSGSATAALTVPAALDFGDVTTGMQATQLLMVTNASTTTLQVVASTMAPFTVAANGCSSVTPAQTCVISVRFDAGAPGSVDGTLALTLPGTSITQNVALKARSVVAGVLRIEPATIFNGDYLDAGQTLDKPFVVRNTGMLTVPSLSLSVSNTSGTAFSLLSTDCVALDAGSTCNGTLRYAPPAFGAHTGLLFVDAGPSGNAGESQLGYGTAVFSATVVLSKPDSGVTVNADGVLPMTCASTCTATAFSIPTSPTTLHLSASRTVRNDFVQWMGDCSGAGGCTLTLDQNRAATADFEPVNVAFQTNSTFNGSQFGGRVGADHICQNIAADAGFNGAFIAFLGVADGGAGARLPQGPGWIRPDGLTFVMSRDALFAGQQINLLDLDERSSPINNTASPVWTGTLKDAGPGVSCDDWMSINPYGTIGDFSDGPHLWTEAPQISNCSYPGHLACFQTDGLGHALAPSYDGGVRMFVTFGVNDGGFAIDAGVDGGPRNYWFDDACTAAAQNLGLGAPYLALLPFRGVAATGRLDAGLNGPVVRPDGVPVFASVHVLNTALNPISFAVYPDGGSGYADVVIMTGSNTPQSPASTTENCNDWTSQTGGTTYTGLSGSAVGFWSPSQTASCAAFWFYCVPR